ncbi:MAG: RagB/SusD family nutrient uptake outer membrane protein [Bacteroidetes bacterium]|nr:RagB/SusD family nutrient uptake outer membrane protein [Bacteroidota bacterium]
MKNIIIKTNLLLCLTILLLSLSCKKFVEIAPPTNQVTATQVFADSANANAAIMGIYNKLGQSYISYGSYTYLMGLYADELNTVTTNSSIKEFYFNSVSPNNNLMGAFWNSPYSFIYMANACLEGLKGNKNISDQAASSLMGEAYCIRGFMHFMLLNFYGQVPIITSTYFERNRLLPRSPTDSVYAQIIEDLKLAQSLLLGTNMPQGRASYYTATALLARVFLYKGNYPSAGEESSKIISSGKFSLMSNLNDVFLANSLETIWQLAQPYPGRETWEGYFLVPSSSTVVPTYIITDTLLNSFEQADKRKLAWVGFNSVNSMNYPYPFKYKKRLSSGPITEKFVVLRLAEQYLIRAEARANLNDIAGALDDINIIRDRAGLENANAVNKEEVLALIETERQHELFCESGHRWFDLKRTRRASTVLSGLKPDWKNTAILFPIYFSELASNPMLSQNEGY